MLIPADPRKRSAARRLGFVFLRLQKVEFGAFWETFRNSLPRNFVFLRFWNPWFLEIPYLVFLYFSFSALFHVKEGRKSRRFLLICSCLFSFLVIQTLDLLSLLWLGTSLLRFFEIWEVGIREIITFHNPHLGVGDLRGWVEWSCLLTKVTGNRFVERQLHVYFCISQRNEKYTRNLG